MPGPSHEKSASLTQRKFVFRDKSGTRLENIAAYNYKEAFVIDPRNGRISINEKLSYASAAIIILTVQVR